MAVSKLTVLFVDKTVINYIFLCLNDFKQYSETHMSDKLLNVEKTRKVEKKTELKKKKITRRIDDVLSRVNTHPSKYNFKRNRLQRV